MSGNGTVGFSVIDTMGFDETIDSMREAVQLFERAKGDVENCAGHLEVTWKGAGGKQFVKYFEKIQQALNDDVEILWEMAQRLSDIKKGYDGVDQECNFATKESTNTHNI